MKELRFAADGGEWRVAFAFDPRHFAIVLVAGDKSGGSEKRFYKQLIKKADKRFTAHCECLKKASERKEIAMEKTLKERLSKLPAGRRAKVEARAAELLAEEMSLKDLRKARELTQEHVAELLGIGQDGISRLEKRSDLLISTLRNYLARMGGQIELVVRFPDRPAVLLQDLAELDAATRGSPAPKKKPQRPSARPTHT